MAHLLVLQLEGREPLNLEESIFDAWQVTYLPVSLTNAPFCPELMLMVIQLNVDAVLIVASGLETWLMSVPVKDWFTIGVPVHHLIGTQAKTFTPILQLPLELRDALQQAIIDRAHRIKQGIDHNFMTTDDLPPELLAKLLPYLPSN